MRVQEGGMRLRVTSEMAHDFRKALLMVPCVVQVQKAEQEQESAQERQF